MYLIYILIYIYIYNNNNMNTNDFIAYPFYILLYVLLK